MKFALNRSLVWCGILSAILSSPHLVVRAADPVTSDPIGAKQEPTETVTFDAKLPSTQLAPVYGANRTKVEIIKRPEIEYPENMRKWGNIGEGLMDVTIDENGKPRDLVVLESSHPAFELAMVRGILGGQYKPATVDGKPVATRVRFPLRFRLADQTDDRKLQARLPFSFTTDDAAGVAADFTYDQPPVIRVVAPAVLPQRATRSSAPPPRR
jgi:TonB family protein